MDQPRELLQLRGCPGSARLLPRCLIIFGCENPMNAVSFTYSTNNRLRVMFRSQAATFPAMGHVFTIRSDSHGRVDSILAHTSIRRFEAASHPKIPAAIWPL